MSHSCHSGHWSEDKPCLDVAQFVWHLGNRLVYDFLISPPSPAARASLLWTSRIDFLAYLSLVTACFSLFDASISSRQIHPSATDTTGPARTPDTKPIARIFAQLSLIIPALLMS